MRRLKFIQLIVVGYNRLALSDTKSYTITFKNIHLILGTNGSGKSSILELVTPLPPNRKDFIEGGFKEIIFELDTDMYRIFSQDNKHTVYKNNELELENAGLKTMIDYCKDVFNITPLIHKFMLGKINITNMSLQERKEFITNISHVDYTYANKLYNNLKKKLRDEQAILKHLNNKVLSLKEYIINEDEVVKLNKKKDELTQVLYSLYSLKENTINSDDSHIDVKKLLDKTNQLLTQAKDVNLYSRVDELNGKLHILRNDKLKLEKEKNILSDKLFEMSKMLSSNELESKLTNINLEIESKTMGRIFKVTEDEYSKYKDIWSQYSNDIQTILNNLLEDIFSIKDMDVDTILDNYNKHIDIYNNYKTEADRLKQLLDTLETKERDYMSISKGLCCSNCNTPIINDKLLSILDNDKKLKIKYREELDVIENKLFIHKQNSNPINDYKLYTSGMERIRNLKLDKFINTTDSLFSIFNSLNTIERDIRVYSDVLSLENEKSKILELSNSILDENSFKQTELEYDNVKMKIELLNMEESEILNYIKMYDTINSNIVDIKRYINNSNKKRKQNISKIKNDSIDLLINDIKLELNNLNIQIDKYNHSIREENSLQLEISKSEEDIRLLEIVISELSPSTGLIADSIKSFLIKYINEVNNIINSVWSYRLDVLAYDVNDLDKGITYRFPVKTIEADNSDDINNTSESMREIISLAFRLISLKYLGLGLYPLMIDEFGRSMDEVHLIKSYDLLENIVEESEIQMLIIAHIKTAYTRFSNAGISIISDLNLEEL